MSKLINATAPVAVKYVYHTMPGVVLLKGDCLDILPDMEANTVQTCVTSPPYWGLRDYGKAGQLGLEKTPDEYVAKMVAVFRNVRRVLRDDGTLWLNLGDSYGAVGGDTYSGFNERWSGTGGAGSKQDAALNGVRGRKNDTGLRPKNLLGIPWRVALALQADGWWLRQDIIWHKPNPMPESVTDRCTKAHEYIFLLSKSAKYYYDNEAVKEDATGTTSGMANSFKRNGSKRGESICPNSPMPTHRPGREAVCYDGPTRNRHSVWTVATKPFGGAHFAVFPPDLITPCILAGSRPGDIVSDPFNGAGTTGLVANALGRQYVGIDINSEYLDMTVKRLKEDKSVDKLRQGAFL